VLDQNRWAGTHRDTLRPYSTPKIVKDK